MYIYKKYYSHTANFSWSQNAPDDMEYEYKGEIIIGEEEIERYNIQKNINIYITYEIY
jgi:hypothetical protein